MKRALLAAPALLLFGACSGEGNTGKVTPPQELVAAVPWTNGAQPVVDAAGRPLGSPLPVFPAIGQDLPDPGSRPIDCSVLDSVELSGWRHHFESPDPTRLDYWGIAQYWSAYDDGTSGSFHAPGDAAWYDGIAGRAGGPALRALEPWGLASDRHRENAPGPACDGQGNNWALHVKGGRFNYYGGGVEHPLSLDCAQQGATAADLCSAPEAAGQNGVFDVSSYDGIAFWARRGPEGGTALMVGLQNKYTSDFLARSNEEQYCRRVKECFPRCDNGAECKPVTTAAAPDPVMRCVGEGADPTLTPEPALMELLFPPCGESACTPPAYFADLQFAGTECKPYTFSGLESNYWCYGDQPPAAPGERCGDGFVKAITLSTDWQFYKLPFEDFQQVGFAKRAPANDLKSLYSIAFQFSVGYADFYVDNVSFYRNK